MSLLKFSEWESGADNRWYCNDTTNFPKWWTPARMLGMELDDYIIMVMEEYNAKILLWRPSKFHLCFYWDNYADVHRFVLFLNREARKCGFTV